MPVAEAWEELCPKGAVADDLDRQRAEYIVQRLTTLDVLPGGVYEAALVRYLTLYLADVRRAGE